VDSYQIIIGQILFSGWSNVGWPLVNFGGLGGCENFICFDTDFDRRYGMQARVLRVQREGGLTSIVAQMRASNTVIKCRVNLEHSQAGALEAARDVTLVVLSCDPPGIVVGVRDALGPKAATGQDYHTVEHGLDEQETLGQTRFRRFQNAFTPGVKPTPSAKRQRQCVFEDDDEGECEDLHARPAVAACRTGIL
jgi:hypothetical protein